MYNYYSAKNTYIQIIHWFEWIFLMSISKRHTNIYFQMKLFENLSTSYWWKWQQSTFQDGFSFSLFRKLMIFHFLVHRWLSLPINFLYKSTINFPSYVDLITPTLNLLKPYKDVKCTLRAGEISLRYISFNDTKCFSGEQ